MKEFTTQLNFDLPTGAKITRTSLQLPPALVYETWLEIGATLKLMEGSVLWWVGDWLAFGEKKYGETYAEGARVTGYAEETVRVAKWVSERIKTVTRVTVLSWAHHREVGALLPERQTYWLKVALEQRLTHKQLRAHIRAGDQLPMLPLPEGKFRTLIIDPPWPVEKIARYIRPNQVVMDYPTMTLERIAALPIQELMAPSGCHVYLWFTQKYRRFVFELFDKWGVKDECFLTWVKNVGFTPYSWMYSTEHVLFGRVGDLALQKLGVRLDFNGKVREHSRKPDEFYQIVREVSPEPRLDFFSREARDGFQQYGNETTKFGQVQMGSPMVGSVYP